MGKDQRKSLFVLYIFFNPHMLPEWTKCVVENFYLLQSACTSMYRHIYNWNIVACDVKQLISLTHYLTHLRPSNAEVYPHILLLSSLFWSVPIADSLYKNLHVSILSVFSNGETSS